jgi:hypothetical protein
MARRNISDCNLRSDYMSAAFDAPRAQRCRQAGRPRTEIRKGQSEQLTNAKVAMTKSNTLRKSSKYCVGPLAEMWNRTSREKSTLHTVLTISIRAP